MKNGKNQKPGSRASSKEVKRGNIFHSNSENHNASIFGHSDSNLDSGIFSEKDTQYRDLIRPNIRKLVAGKRFLVKDIEAIDLLTPERFDVVAKLIYAKHKYLDVDSDWAEKLYKEHLRVFNGFMEPDESGKSTYRDFLECFNITIDSIGKRGFDNKLSLLPIGHGNILLDGSHRIAACIQYNRKPTGIFFDVPAFIYDYKFFQNYKKHSSMGLVEKYTDPMALEYCRIKPNTYIASIFPAAVGKDQEIRKLLSESGKIVYEKALRLRNAGPVLLMRQMYRGESWLGNGDNKFLGARQKAAFCFPKSGDLRVFLIESDKQDLLTQAKSEIRKLFDIGNHSIHINDRHNETIRLAQVYFNRNSIHFLNNANDIHFRNFFQHFEFFRKWLQDGSNEDSYYCIGGSGPLAMYGLREARDLDFLSFRDAETETGNSKVQSHNKEINHYPYSIDDIIFNPENHFYFDGVKFITLEVLKQMKSKRNEPKDQNDLAFIETIEARRDLLLSGEKIPDATKLINIVYKHTNANGFATHKANTTIVWSQTPLMDCDVYAYLDAFSYNGPQGGKNVLLMHEPIVVLPGQYDPKIWEHFDYIFTSLDSLSECSEKFIKFLHPTFDRPTAIGAIQRLETRYRIAPEERKIAVCMINNNKSCNVPGELYSSRVDIAAKFYKIGDIDFDVYGFIPFENLPNYVGSLPTAKLKFETLAKYRFSLCFENLYDPFWSKGYLTEKLPHCLVCGTVPIYYGCTNIEEYIPSECYIDYREFETPEQLSKYLKGMSEAEYRKYYEDIANWVDAGGLKKFSIYHEYDLLMKLANPEMQEKVVDSLTWNMGPSPKDTGRKLQLSETSPVWSWDELTNKWPSADILWTSGNYLRSLAKMDSSSDQPYGSGRKENKNIDAAAAENLADNPWMTSQWDIKAIPDSHGLVDLNGVKGYLGTNDIKLLLEYAEKLPQDGVIAEIGSFMGLSAIVMACGLHRSGNRNARIHCVDPWADIYLKKLRLDHEQSLFDSYMSNVVKSGFGRYVIPIRKNSLEASKGFKDQSIDLLFVDGDHSYESCYADLNAWLPKMKQDGIVIGHDCRPESGVLKAVERFSRENELELHMAGFPPNDNIFELDLKSRGLQHVRTSTKSPRLSSPNDSNELFSIIILNFNGGRRVNACIESIQSCTPETHEIIVIDNASTDRSLEYLRSLEQITLVENPDNIGCPPARTQAMSLAQGDFIVLLDNDTIVTPGWLTKLAGHLKNHPSIGLIGPCTNNASGPQKIQAPKYSDNTELNDFASHFWDANKPPLLIVHRLVGFCMLIKRSVIDMIGAPDPRFGKFGFEDDDYTWRAAIAGFQAAVARDVYIHHEGGPQGKGNKEYNQYLHEAWEIFKEKWGLSQDLDYGAAFDISEVLRQPFNKKNHYIQIPEKSDVEMLITNKGTARSDQFDVGNELDLEKLLAEGEKYFSNEQYERAERVFCHIVSQSRIVATAYNNLGVLSLARGENQEALGHYRKAVDFWPENLNFQKNLAELYAFKLGKAEEAIAIINMILKQAPADEDALLTLLSIAESVGDTENADTIFLRLQSLFPEKYAQPKDSPSKGVKPHSLEHATVKPQTDGEEFSTVLFIVCHEKSTEKLAGMVNDYLSNSDQRFSVVCVGEQEMTPNGCGLDGDSDINFEFQGTVASINKSVEKLSGENSQIFVIDAGSWLGIEGIQAMIDCQTYTEKAGIVGALVSENLSNELKKAIAHADKGQFEGIATAFLEKYRGRRKIVQRLESRCWTVKKSVWDQAGGLDTRFETVHIALKDFSIRTVFAGYLNVVAADVISWQYATADSTIYEMMKHDRRRFNAKWRDISLDSEIGRDMLVFNTLEKASQLALANDLPAALEALTQGMRQLPGDHRLPMALTHILISQQQYKEALEILEQVREENLRTEVAELRGYCLEGLGEYDEAQGLIEELLQQFPDKAVVLNLSGMLAYRLGDSTQARQYFEKAIKLDPGFGDPHANIGVMVFEAGDKENAFEKLSRGFLLTPDANHILVNFHKAILATGNYDSSETLFRAAMDLYPDNKALRFYFIDLMLNAGWDQKAMDAIESGLVEFGADDEFINAAIDVRGRLGALQIPETPERPTLSLCMIVKNESHCLAKCLQSTKLLVDEIVVVDTGSEDHTKAIAEVFGARVFDYPWTNDFAAARNFAIDQAKGDWILVLDADEVIAPQDVENLEEVMRNHHPGPTAVSITTRNYVNKLNTFGDYIPNRGGYPCEEAGIGWFASTKVRLFTNHPELRFVHPVHELVESNAQKAGIPIVQCQVPIHHYGKLENEKIENKGEAYFELGLKKIAQGKGEIKEILELAAQASELGRHADAIDIWQQAIKKDPINPNSYLGCAVSLMATADFQKAKKMAAQAHSLNPRLKAALLNFAICCFYTGAPQTAIDVLDRYLKKVPGQPVARAVYAASLAAVGRETEAVKAMRELAGEGYESKSYLSDLVRELVSQGRIRQAEKVAMTAVVAGVVNERLFDLIQP